MLKNIEELHTQSLKTNMTDMIKPIYILMILAVITSCVFTKDTERVVTIDSNEKAFGCNSFEFIDSQTFKIDNIIYSLNNNHLEVTGYNKRFEGKARFISALNPKRSLGKISSKM